MCQKLIPGFIGPPEEVELVVEVPAAEAEQFISSFWRLTFARWFLNHSCTFFGSREGKRCLYGDLLSSSVNCSIMKADGWVSSLNHLSRRGISVNGSMKTRLLFLLSPSLLPVPGFGFEFIIFKM